jgi:MYXO-CTERM domain-containing protein
VLVSVHVTFFHTVWHVSLINSPPSQTRHNKRSVPVTPFCFARYRARANLTIIMQRYTLQHSQRSGSAMKRCETAVNCLQKGPRAAPAKVVAPAPPAVMVAVAAAVVLAALAARRRRVDGRVRIHGGPREAHRGTRQAWAWADKGVNRW